MTHSKLRASRYVAFRLQVLMAWCAMSLFTFAASAPNLKLKDLRGKTQQLASLRGQIVVVNFWATWCAPCQQELPRLSQLAQQWAGKEVQFVAVSIDNRKDQEKIGPTLQRLRVAQTNNFSVWVGSSNYSLRAFGLGDMVPGTVVIDRRGRIVTRITGEARDNDIRSAVNWLLNGGVGSPPPTLVKRL